jgi:hypothetical protein
LGANVWEAFLDYRYSSMQLSRIEKEIVVALIANCPERAAKIAEHNGLLTVAKNGALASNRERTKIEEKPKTLGLTPPWKS